MSATCIGTADDEGQEPVTMRAVGQKPPSNVANNAQLPVMVTMSATASTPKCPVASLDCLGRSWQCDPGQFGGLELPEAAAIDSAVIAQ